MRFKKLNDGNEIPMIGIGTWQLTEQEIGINALKYALKIGYTHIDTADIYGNQDIVKEAIKGKNREKLYITSKLWREFLDPKLVESECDKALMELDLDYLDLYLVHWPDRTKPLAEISYEMSKLKEKGKLKSFGVSNYTINHLQELLDQGIKVAINQVEFHPFLNQSSLLDFCNRHSISVTAYSPLARRKVFHDPDIKQISKKYSKTGGQIALRWLIQKDIVVIPKASSEKHIKDNFEIFDFELSISDMQKIDEIGKIRPKRLINPEFGDFEY
ncbi:MAG: 2,5-diketo-D-gluconic acid reductase A [Candidatus Anoxychlamydiales bacterium]|nr:2,5-diketo-D-gluconic acid reductase A [Candidatus Anoxychlamydiales bacterium]